MDDILSNLAEKGDLEEFMKIYSNKILNVQKPISLGGQGLLHIAIKGLNIPIIEFLINEGIDLDLQDDEGYTVLHYYNKLTLDIAEKIISSGSNTNIKDNYGNTPLWYILNQASQKILNKQNYVQIADLLIKNGSDPYSKNNVNKEPIEWVRIWRDKELLEILEKYNINLDN